MGRFQNFKYPFMSLSNQTKQEIIVEHQKFSKDTGSVEVQVALLSADIDKLTRQHFQIHKKDYHSKRGLLQKVSKRRKLLRYLKRVDSQRYKVLIEKLNLRSTH